MGILKTAPINPTISHSQSLSGSLQRKKELPECLCIVPRAWLTFALCLYTIAAGALDFSKLNLSYMYDPANGFECHYRVAQSGRDVIVYYSIAAVDIADFETYFLIQNGYESPSHDTLKTYTLDTLAYEENRATYKLTIPTPKKNLLLLSFLMDAEGIYNEGDASDTGFNLSVQQTLIYDVPLSSPAGFPEFVPVDENGLPVLKNYVTTDQVRISGEADRYHAFSYLDEFGPADPAMGAMKQIAPSLDIDSSFYFQNTLTSLEDYHFYLIQSDTLADNAVTLLKCPYYYPETKRLEELIVPLTYITTPSELKALTDQMSREAFERFWLSTYGTKFRAKNAIKFFYDRIESANKLFTDYKQGWETDRGMLYIIFGKPDIVLRSERSEIWQYNQGVEFEFIRISTLFTPSLYSLKRDKKYEEVWYEQVGNIRKGI